MSKFNRYQFDLILNLKAKYDSYQTELMGDIETEGAIATQVSNLTKGKMHYGDFKMKDGYLVNKDKKILIVYPEKILIEKDLFKQVQKDFELSSDKINFLIKNDLSDINYLVRDNGYKGKIEHEGKHYMVYEEKQSALDDATTAILLEQQEVKPKNKKKNNMKKRV